MGKYTNKGHPYPYYGRLGPCHFLIMRYFDYQFHDTINKMSLMNVLSIKQIIECTHSIIESVHSINHLLNLH